MKTEVEKKSIILTPTDVEAVLLGDDNFINNKGGARYKPGSYGEAVEYYRLGAAMGNIHSIANLGYCYLYGRDIEQNTSIALAYFTIAARRGNVDAAYKLGDIYSRDKWVSRDMEKAIYYFRMAASYLLDDEEDWEQHGAVIWHHTLKKYPSLCYALGREMAEGGNIHKNLELSYQFLKQAEVGYQQAIADGDEMYITSYEGVKQLLADAQFDLVRDKIDALFLEGQEENVEL